MEGFVHQTRYQRLSALKTALQSVYTGSGPAPDFEFEAALQRLEQAEQKLEDNNDSA